MKIRNTQRLVTLAILLIATVAMEAQALPVPIITSPPPVVGQIQSVSLSPSPNFLVSGHYPELITQYRTLLKPGLLPAGDYTDTRYDFLNHYKSLVGFDDEAWSDWTAWPPGHDHVRVQYADLPERDDQNARIHYIFAAQIMAADGAVSLARDYGVQVANFRVSSTLAPLVSIEHRLLGAWTAQGLNSAANLDVMRDVPGLFSWEADATGYGGFVVSSRWGWDLADPDDPDDPNWQVPPGVDPENWEAGPIPFASGVHTFTIQVFDAAGAETRWVMLIDMVPVPDLPSQLPLLLVDDVADQSSNSWQGADGTPLDNDTYRDAFWEQALAGSGGVAWFDPEDHVIDAENELVSIRDLVMYRAVIWNSRWASAPVTAIASDFRPEADNQLKYTWLGSYQERAGNLILCGERITGAFLEESPYVLPIVFQSPEGDDWRGYEIRGYGRLVRSGFGFFEGTDEWIYPWLYPYRNLGLATQDITSPTMSSLYDPAGMEVNLRRKSPCVAVKGLVLDSSFAAAYGVAGAIPDTIWTESTIDWQDDPDPNQGDVLTLNYIWGNDELYNEDIAHRNIPYSLQDCDGQPCVEPMLRTIARFDWVRYARQLIDPDDPWPEGYYGGQWQPTLDEVCGVTGLDLFPATARTNDRVTAFVTHKFREQKPVPVGDVVLGFDPYRFDHAAATSMIRWVLGEHFGLTMNP